MTNKPPTAGPRGGEQERRRWPRIRLDLAVKVRFATVQDVIDSRTIDISRGGVFIKMTKPKFEGTHVSMAMEIGERAIDAKGVVVRSVRQEDLAGPPGIGVVFTEISDQDRAFLDGLVAGKRTAG